MESSRAVADESRMDVERDELRSSEAQNIKRRKMTKTSMEESRMDDEGRERDESGSSEAQNTRRRKTTKTPTEESRKDDEGKEEETNSEVRQHRTLDDEM